MKRILITGAAGNVASLVIPDLQKDYKLVFTDSQEPKTPLEPFTKARLEDYAAMLELCRGVDTVLHFGALAFDQDWHELISANVVGVQHVLLAAKEAACRRVILFSSVQAVWGHSHASILETDAAYPTNFYGATKAFAETLGRMHSHDGQLSVLCIRLGAVLRPNDLRLRPSYQEANYGITARDLCALLRCCLETNHHFAVFHGVSDNQNNTLSLEQTKKVLGYQPQDDVVRQASSNWLTEIRWFWKRAKSVLWRILTRGFYVRK